MIYVTVTIGYQEGHDRLPNIATAEKLFKPFIRDQNVLQMRFWKCKSLPFHRVSNSHLDVIKSAKY